MPDRQLDLVEADPELFFVPPTAGPSGRVGVRLGRKPDWALVSDRVAEAYRPAAPKPLLGEIERRERAIRVPRAELAAVDWLVAS